MRIPSITLIALCGCGQGELNLDTGDTDAPGNPDIVITQVQIEPSEAYTNTDLTVTASVEADDVDSLVWTYTWLADGQPVQEGEARTLLADLHRRDQSIVVRAVASDGEIPSAAVSSEPVVIQNTAPSYESASVAPEQATAATELTCTPTEGFDLDGDPITPRFSWWVNDDEVRLNSPTFGPGSASRGDEVSCSVVPTDGTDEGPAVRSGSVLIENSRPVVDAVSILPRPAFTDSTLTGEIVARDADGDALTTTWSWEVNGEEVGTSSGLASAAFVRDDRVQLFAAVSDGEASSVRVGSEPLTIRNSPPTVPSVEITPSLPRYGEPLFCDILEPSTDADGDRITYVIDWFVDGDKFDGDVDSTLHDGDTLPGGIAAEGESWTCKAQAWDRIDTSAWSDASEAVEIGEGIWVIDIPLDQLVNQGFGCWDDGGRRYTCSGNYGFYWDDPAEIQPETIDVEYNHGWNCNSGNRTAYINGTDVGTARTGDRYNCGCGGDRPSWNKSGSYRAPDSYEPGERNTFTMSRVSCEGFDPEPDWALDDGTRIYARITLTY